MGKFLPFAEALAVAQSLNLAGQKGWWVWCKEGRRPPNVPAAPNDVYKDGGWQGWGHWLGTGNIKPGTAQFLPFGEALAVARSLGLASAFEWRVWCSEGLRPRVVPSMPNRVYEDHGWQGWGHWLGTGNQVHQKKNFLPFKEALVVARSLGLPGRREWQVWSREGLRPPNVPAAPNKVYKDYGWQGWGHWLGSGNIKKPSKFAPFGQVLTFAQSLGLAGKVEWDVWCKEGRRPPNVPSNPDKIYKDGGWQGWGHWLGTGNLNGGKKNFLPFDEALCAARQLRLVSQAEWRLWCRSGARPANMPAAPDKAYVHDGWMGWVHWLRHANLDPELAPALVRPVSKRAAPGRAGAASSRGRGKRRRR